MRETNLDTCMQSGVRRMIEVFSTSQVASGPAVVWLEDELRGFPVQEKPEVV
jgi:hypothetical protein